MPVLVLDGHEIKPLRGGPGWALWSEGTVLAGAAGAPAGGRRLALWSGGIEGEDGHADPRTWGPAGWAALERGLGALAVAGGRELLVRTHHAHAVSDVPSSQRLLRARAGGPPQVGLLVDVGAMIAPSMLGAAEDHAARILGALAGMEGVGAVVASSPGADGGPAPLHAGVVPGGVLAGLISRHVPARVPLVLLGGHDAAGIGRQVDLLAGLPHVS